MRRRTSRRRPGCRWSAGWVASAGPNRTGGAGCFPPRRRRRAGRTRAGPGGARPPPGARGPGRRRPARGPPVGDAALDALLARDGGPGETAAPLRPVADVLAALRAAPGRGELTGLDPVLAEFRGAGGAPAGWHRSRPRRPALRRALLSVKVAAAVAAAVLGGGVAAAYAGVLPAALQLIAHHAIAAPAASAAPGPHQARRAGVPVGPDPAGPAAHGLCPAYAHAPAQGSAAP